MQVKRQTWKPAVCLAYGALVHIDDKVTICEKCEEAGVVPIYLRCLDPYRQPFPERSPNLTRRLRDVDPRELTVYNFEDAVKLVCRLNASTDVEDLCRKVKAGADINPCSNEQDGDSFAHLDQ